MQLCTALQPDFGQENKLKSLNKVEVRPEIDEVESVVPENDGLTNFSNPTASGHTYESNAGLLSRINEYPCDSPLNERHRAAEIVREYRNFRGGPIFERPDAYKKLKVPALTYDERMEREAAW